MDDFSDLAAEAEDEAAAPGSAPDADSESCVVAMIEPSRDRKPHICRAGWRGKSEKSKPSATGETGVASERRGRVAMRLAPMAMAMAMAMARLRIRS